MKIAIIGCGKQAPKHILGFLNNDVDDFVFYDVNRNAAERLADKFSGSVANTLEEIYRDKNVDAIDICTPVKYHYPIIKESIKANKHYFCEKPLSLSLDEDIEIDNMTKQSGLIGMVGYIYRFVPALSKCKNILRGADQANACTEILGNVHTAVLRIGGRGSHMAWKHRRETDGGALNEMAVHMVDLAYWYFGEMEKMELLECETRQQTRVISDEIVDCDTEDWVVASLTSKSGVRILILADFVTPAFTQFIEVQGSNGSLTASINPSYDSNLFLIEGKNEFSSGNTSLSDGSNDFFRRQMEEFVQSIKNNTNVDRNTVADSVAVMQIMETLKSQVI